jgi:hypothetical protein
MSMYFVKQGGLPEKKPQSQQKSPSPHDMDVVTGPSGQHHGETPEPETNDEMGGWHNGQMN